MSRVPYLLAGLETYLNEQEYAPSTVRGYVFAAEKVLTALEEGGELPHPTDKGRAAIQRLLDDAQRADLGDWFDDLQTYVQSGKHRTPLQARRARERRKQRETRSYPEADWRRLFDHVADERSPMAAVILVLMSTGVRVSEVMSLTKTRLREALETGAVRLKVKGQKERTLSIVGVDAWAVLYKRFIDAPTKPETVAKLVSPRGNGDTSANGAAYHRLYRYLKRIHKALKLSGEGHPHRLRRSLAVHALRETEDVIAVQQLLGHESYHSTMRYLDEARPDKVRQIQQKTLRRLRGVTDLKPGEDE